MIYKAFILTFLSLLISLNICAQKVKGEKLKVSNFKFENVLLHVNKDSISFKYINDFDNALKSIFQQRNIRYSHLVEEEYDSIKFNKAINSGVNAIIFLKPKATKRNFNINQGKTIIGLIYGVTIVNRNKKNNNEFVWQGTIELNILNWSSTSAHKTAKKLIKKLEKEEYL